MARIHRGGELVPRGSYWHPSTGEWVAFAEEGGILPVRPGKYVRMAPGLMLLLAPILGLLYWLLLPGVFFAVLIQFVLVKMSHGAKAAWRAVAHAGAH